MKTKIFILIFSIFSACYSPESKSYYPANPPMDLKIILLSSGPYTGDYLLLFRSENRNNSRFGGFLVFTDSSEELVLEKTEPADAVFTYGEAAIPAEDSLKYNPTSGIDTQLAILFTYTGSPAVPGDTITAGSENYSLTAVRIKNALSAGSCLVMRSYLWDDINNKILQVGEPGNVVQIP
jgi:hypothetical protein